MLVVDVVEAKLKLISCLSRNKCRFQNALLLDDVDVVVVVEVVAV